tara:strand:+ start:631 stop:834 length:204 start_codon:yes stop_codon:yes gene_type:complete
MWGLVKEVVDIAFFIATFSQYDFWQEERVKRPRITTPKIGLVFIWILVKIKSHIYRCKYGMAYIVKV